MPTLRPDQAPVNAPKVVSPQASATQVPMRQPAIGAGNPGIPARPGTPTNPGLSAGQPAPSVGATRPMATTQPAMSKKPAPAKTGLEGLTPQASLQPGRRKQIIDIISKHAEHLPTNCALTLVEKLVEKHAERALSGVTDVIKKAALKRLLKRAFINPGTLSGAISAGEDARMLGALGGTGGGLAGGVLGSALGGAGGLIFNPKLALLLAAIGGLGGSLYGGHAIGKSIRKLKNEPKEPAESEQTKTSAVKGKNPVQMKAAANCPGGKLRSKGKGRGMGYGKGKGPVGVPVGEKEPAAMTLAKTSQVKIPIVDLRAVREFVKRSSDKPKAARLFARLVKATTILNSKG